MDELLELLEQIISDNRLSDMSKAFPALAVKCIIQTHKDSKFTESLLNAFNTDKESFKNTLNELLEHIGDDILFDILKNYKDLDVDELK